MDTFMIKIILLVAICICFYLIYLLLCRRNSFLELNSFNAKKEGFLVTNSINPVKDTYADMPINEYVIKSSYNSAYGTDGNISVANVKKNLTKENARVLDFHIFLEDDKVVVGYSSNNDGTIDSNNVEPFAKIMNGVVSNGFSCTNGSDPLFIHLRIGNSIQKPKLDDIAKTLKNTFQNKLFHKKLNKTIKLKELRNKVAIITSIDYSTKSPDLHKVTHVVSGSNTLNSTTDSTKTSSACTFTPGSNERKTGIDVWQMTTPDVIGGINTSQFYKLMKTCGVQICFHMFYVSTNLEKYTTFFESHGSAFVPLSSAISYVDNNGGIET